VTADPVRNHTIVIGYGTKGRTAADALLGAGVAPAEIVVIDTDRAALDQAATAGLVTVHGNATRSDVLRLAGAQHTAAIIVATDRDDTAVLITFAARVLAPKAKIVVSVREADHQNLLRRSGADSVVMSSETAGRLLGIATSTPNVVDMMEDLLTPETGFTIAERDVAHKEIGRSPAHLSDIVLGVVRNGVLLRVDAPDADTIKEGDRLIYIHSNGG
jgi:voltage-gated potassium channel